MTLSTQPISLLNPYLVNRRSPNGTSTNTGLLGQAVSTISQQVQSSAHIFHGVSHFLVGFVSLFASAVAASLLKDNTLADWLSKVGVIAGGIIAGTGIYKLLKFNKSKKEELPPDSHFRVNPTLEKDLKTVVSNIADIDQSYKKLNCSSSLLCQGKSDSNLRKEAIKLLELRLKDDFVSKIADYTGGANCVVDNAKGPGEALTQSELRDELAVLLGYLVSSRSTDDATYKDIVETKLKDSEVEAGNCKLMKILPADFNLVYTIARAYDKEHNQASQEDSITSKFNRAIETDLETKLSSTSGSSDKDAALKYLLDFQNTHNYLKTLRQAITYVLSEPQNGREDTVRARNIAIIRQALVTAFKIKGNDLATINEQLVNILNGDSRNTGDKKGLTARIGELDTHLTKIQEMIGRSKTRLICESEELVFNTIFPSSIGLVKFKETQPVPVS